MRVSAGYSVDAGTIYQGSDDLRALFLARDPRLARGFRRAVLRVRGRQHSELDTAAKYAIYALVTLIAALRDVIDFRQAVRDAEAAVAMTDRARSRFCGSTARRPSSILHSPVKAGGKPSDQRLL